MKIKIVNIAILLVTLFGTLTVLSLLPDIIPVHFNIQGVADRWGSKYEMLVMPVIMAVMLGIWFVCDIFYRKKAENTPDEKERAEAKANIKVINITFTAISATFMLLNATILYMSYTQLESSYTPDIDVMRIVTVIMGILFVIMGNVMPKTRPNSTVGFRLPWTRFNDVTWHKCNRFGGIVMVISGLITAICGVIFGGIVSTIIMLLAVFGSLIILLIYAYLVYTDEVKKSKS